MRGHTFILICVVLFGCGDSNTSSKKDQGVDTDAGGDGSSSKGEDLASTAADLSGVDLHGLDLSGVDLYGVDLAGIDFAYPNDGGGTLTCSAYIQCVSMCADDACSTACYTTATEHAKNLLQAYADCEYTSCFTGVNPQCMPSERTMPTTIMCQACEKFARMFGMANCPTQYQACEDDT